MTKLKKLTKLDHARKGESEREREREKEGNNIKFKNEKN